jgi:hypothetical protein
MYWPVGVLPVPTVEHAAECAATPIRMIRMMSEGADLRYMAEYLYHEGADVARRTRRVTSKAFPTCDSPSPTTPSRTRS